MAEFKFSCPHCSQRIQCDTGYAGMQINCPSCQKAIMVPQAPRPAAPPPPPPAAGGPPPPPPPPGAAPALATRQSTTAPATGRRFAGAPSLAGGPPPKPRKKSGALKAVLSVTAALVGAAIGFFGVQFALHHVGADKPKGNPAALVPPPTVTAATEALGILEKVHEAYTNLSSLSVSGTSVMIVDLSQVTAADLNPGQTAKGKAATRRPSNLPKGITNSTEVSIKLARPDLYRIEQISRTDAGRQIFNTTNAVWSSGATNYALTVVDTGRANQSFKNYTSFKDRRTALMRGGGQSGLPMVVSQLFFDDATGGNIGRLIKDWGQTGDESCNGQECYTVTGKFVGQKLKVWISKSSYLILKSEITLGAPISDADFDEAFDALTPTNSMTAQQLEQVKAQAKQQIGAIAKIRGTLTETYDTVEVNQPFTPDDFNYPVPRGVRLVPTP